ncbi:hypothetical protein SAMN04487970_105611 [Paenibacillus tianmuensis]|uniref:Uncharacterized protein n=1 Tax=Paenibacillus tianmuensis TaxID=624147 RepID=A0A1G4TKY2_9BACL|nr:hypothetical protein SAMN04487970_105611 [Paenibacillus tianmuensis]
MQLELKDKSEELSRLSVNFVDFHASEEYIVKTKYDIQTFLSLLDQEAPNPQLLHSMGSTFISKLNINRDTSTLYLTIQLTNQDKIM